MSMHETAENPSSSSVWDAAGSAFRRWRDGDQRALDELVRVMSPVLWHVVRATGLEREPAEDVVQNTWLAMVRSADRIADPQAVSGWLCTTARREAWRTRKRAARSTPIEDDALDYRLPHEDSPETRVVLDDEQRLLWEGLRRLPERCQRLLRIVAMEQRPDYTRIAADLDMPVGSIGPTRGRCLDKLRAELTRTGGAR
jgi:RNA polymerase sigma factor (sigma-70 family)